MASVNESIQTHETVAITNSVDPTPMLPEGWNTYQQKISWGMARLVAQGLCPGLGRPPAGERRSWRVLAGRASTPVEVLAIDVARQHARLM